MHTMMLRYLVLVSDLVQLIDQQISTNTSRVVMQDFCAHLPERALRRTGMQVVAALCPLKRTAVPPRSTLGLRATHASVLQLTQVTVSQVSLSS